MFVYSTSRVVFAYPVVLSATNWISVLSPKAVAVACNLPWVFASFA
jgi:hypothetical protein